MYGAVRLAFPERSELSPEFPSENSSPVSLQAMEERFALHMREVQTGIKASIDSLSRTFAELHNSLREERDVRRQEQAQLESALLARVDEVQVRGLHTHFRSHTPAGFWPSGRSDLPQR